jgi:hypothetical protein
MILYRILRPLEVEFKGLLEVREEGLDDLYSQILGTRERLLLLTDFQKHPYLLK